MCVTRACGVCVLQVSWVEQQVVRRRVKRDYKAVPPPPSQSSIFFNDAKWNSMWYIVSMSESLCVCVCVCSPGDGEVVEQVISQQPSDSVEAAASRRSALDEAIRVLQRNLDLRSIRPAEWRAPPRLVS